MARRDETRASVLAAARNAPPGPPLVRPVGLIPALYLRPGYVALIDGRIVTIDSVVISPPRHGKGRTVIVRPRSWSGVELHEADWVLIAQPSTKETP